MAASQDGKFALPTDDVEAHGTAMTNHTNVDLFRIYSGTTFALLYDAFPLSKELKTTELVEHCKLAADKVDQAKHELIVRETWRWLVEAGYLHKNAETGRFDLTLRSFEGLTFLDNPNDGVCRGDRLVRLSQKVGVETVSETIAEIVTKVLGTSTRAALSVLA